MAAKKKRRSSLPRRSRRHRFPARDIARYHWEGIFESTLRGLVDSGNLKSPVEQAADIADAALTTWKQRYPNI
jgi:hypothetical protein